MAPTLPDRRPVIRRRARRAVLAAFCLGLCATIAGVLPVPAQTPAAGFEALRQKARQLPPVPARFDPDEALRLLEPGNSALHGRLYTKVAPLRRKYSGHQFVWLVPMTAYAREWVRMHMTPERDGLKTNDDLPLAQLLVDERVSAHLARTLSREDGSFAFDSLQAGEYVLIAMSQDVKAQNFRPVVGYDTQTVSTQIDQRCSHGVCSPIYAQQEQQVPIYSDRIETVFDVKDYNTVRVVTLGEDQALDLGTIRSRRIR
jgi:hypothetical protein